MGTASAGLVDDSAGMARHFVDCGCFGKAQHDAYSGTRAGMQPDALAALPLFTSVCDAFRSDGLSEDVTYAGGKVRLFVEAALAEGARVELSDAQSHYLSHVMRARAGNRVRLFNGHDGEWLASVAEQRRRGVSLACERQTAPQKQVPDIWLAFAPIKRTPADYVAQKATELGVRRLQPVMTRRTIVGRVNLERLRANAIEAAEQSGRVSVPEVSAAVALPALLQHWDPNRTLFFCDEGKEAEPIAAAVSAASGAQFAILTGPEGGFDPSERDLLRRCSFVVPVTLGKRILRADTAGLAALAVWQSIKGDWR
jgi:16S rRNA (uracil1498-N3)-methyltransferase